jgi:hypothetical protein
VNTSHPGGQAYYASLVELYEEWGVDFLKMDCSFAIDMTAQHEAGVATLSKYLHASKRDFVLR